MVSKLEIKVRELDNEKENMGQASRRISTELNANKFYIRHLIVAKRRGFPSYAPLKKYLFERRDLRQIDYLNLLAKSRGLEDVKELREQEAINKGFLGNRDYLRYLSYKRKRIVRNEEEYFDGLWRSKEQNLTNSELEAIPSNGDFSLIGILEAEDKKDEIKNRLSKILGELPNKYREIIVGRYYQEKTLEEIGGELNLTGERIRQLEIKAMEKLRYLAKKHNLEDYYIT